MEKVKMDGHGYSIELEGQYKARTGYGSNDWGDYTYLLADGQGDGRITDKADGSSQIFHFITKVVRGDSSLHYYDRFERIVLQADKPIIGHDNSYKQPALYLSLDLAVDPLKLVDCLAEMILAKITQAGQKTILPFIEMPVLSIDELIEQGILTEPEGQIRMSINA